MATNKVFRFRLEAQDGSGHFRQGRIEAASKEEAKLTLEERERDAAAFQLKAENVAELLKKCGAKSLDDLPAAAPADASEEEKAAFRDLHVKYRAWLNRHRQAQPYKVVKLEEVS